MDPEQERLKDIVEQIIEINKIRLIRSNEIKIEKKEVGSGGQASVCKGILDGKVVVVKKLTDVDYKLLSHELVIVASINHPNVPKFHGIYYESDVIELIFDYVDGGNLSEYDYEKMSEATKIGFMHDVASAIQCLHKNGFVHRDLKPENIMVEEKTKTAFLIDFGIAKVVNQKLREKTRAKGTYYYIPPEIFDEEDSDENGNILVKVSTAMDIWSIGCIISYLFSGFLPWTPMYKNKENVIIGHISNKDPFPIPENITNPTIVELIKKCTVVDPSKRCKISEVVSLLEEAKKQI